MQALLAARHKVVRQFTSEVMSNAGPWKRFQVSTPRITLLGCSFSWDCCPCTFMPSVGLKQHLQFQGSPPQDRIRCPQPHDEAKTYTSEGNSFGNPAAPWLTLSAFPLSVICIELLKIMPASLLLLWNCLVHTPSSRIWRFPCQYCFQVNYKNISVPKQLNAMHAPRFSHSSD